MGFAIAFLVQSVDRSPFVCSIPLGLLEAGGQGISIAVVIHSVDPHPTNVLFKQALTLRGGA